MSDATFTTAGFKYPDRIYGKHIADLNSCYQTCTSNLIGAKRNKNSYLNFGVNLGPKRPIMPLTKYLNPIHS